MHCFDGEGGVWRAMAAAAACCALEFRMSMDVSNPFGNHRNCRIDVIVFFLSKRPGGSASNRVFSVSVLKIDFFRDTLFFQVEDRIEAPTFTLQIQ
jgi:hypothetical protein